MTLVPYYIKSNNANLRDLIAVTGLVILLKGRVRIRKSKSGEKWNEQFVNDLPSSIIGEDSIGWQCMVHYKHLWNLWNGNTWPPDVHMGQVIMHGRRGLTSCNVSRGRSTWCLAQSLPSAWQTFVELLLRNKSIGFDNSRCIWKPVVYRVQYYIHFATGLMLKPK